MRRGAAGGLLRFLSLAVLVGPAMPGAGCGGGSREYFRPIDHGVLLSGDTFASAGYALGDARGDLAIVALRRARVARVEGPRGAQTLIRLRVELSNRAGEPVWLDLGETRIEAVLANGQRLPTAQQVVAAHPVDDAPGLAVPVGATRAIDLDFAAPASLGPRDLEAFRLRFGVRSATRGVVQVTVFRDAPKPPIWWYPPLG